jgi:polysaccharide biosynthesis protein PslA
LQPLHILAPLDAGTNQGLRLRSQSLNYDAQPRDSTPSDTGSAMPRREPVLKRPFDLVLATLGLLFSAPLWPLIACAIKLEDGGPVFFVQKRWGRSGAIIRVRKFRSMVLHTDSDSGKMPARENDPRVTRVGAVLRRMGLDELPQLLSIWLGDMSLVGPRALACDESYRDAQGGGLRYEDVPGFGERLQVRPGLTGLATIYLPKDAHPRDRFAVDVRYVNTQSLTQDAKLVLLSLWISVRGRWETRSAKVGRPAEKA